MSTAIPAPSSVPVAGTRDAVSPTTGTPTADAPTTVVRIPTAMEQLELRALAHRLGDTVPEQPVAVAVVDDRVVAGRSLATGVVLFDPADAPAPVRAALRRFADGH